MRIKALVPHTCARVSFTASCESLSSRMYQEDRRQRWHVYATRMYAVMTSVTTAGSKRPAAPGRCGGFKAPASQCELYTGASAPTSE
ncbi:hypothetical protein EVAR_10943_1 [Eumeta japonica]|uniref:Uncharacterized protein n=1 Tax=Eumeta variegata TaxID=151549 RepID=A0A4C1U5Z7_EUMVA|nr:hypothetical protein EVAR_10943_1 [Eumeta japonica]